MDKENITISFKELIDYVRDKDFEIKHLTNILKGTEKKLERLIEEQHLLQDYLYNKGIILAIKRNEVFEVPRKEDENNE